MPIPSPADLSKRQEVATARIARLQAAYGEFLSVWKEVEAEEKELLDEVHGFIDKAHIHNVLQKIDSIKD